MNKRVYGRKLGRTTNERRALFRSLAVAFFTHGRIDTTEAKAKAVRPWIEKLVTRSKTSNLTSRRLLLSELPNQKVVESLLTNVGPTFTTRPGGYTRLTKIGSRFGDNAPMVRLEFVEEIKGLSSKPAVVKKEEKPVEEVSKAKLEVKKDQPTAIKQEKAVKTATVKNVTQRKTPASGK